jgi:group I intron endonuclease
MGSGQSRLRVIDMFENYSGIYQIRNITNNKRYIGSAISIHKRKMAHIRLLENNKHYNIHLQRAYNKDGKDNFIFEVLLFCSKDYLKFYEQRAIDAYDFSSDLYNIMPNARSSIGIILSEETKIKIGLSNKGKKRSKESIEKSASKRRGVKKSEEFKQKCKNRQLGKKYSDETKKKMSESRKGEKNHNFGKKFSKEYREKISKSHKNPSEETRKKISEAGKGRRCSEETREKHRNAMLGKKHTIESKKKMSDSAKNRRKLFGEENPFYGKHHSEETRKKISIKKSGANNHFFGKHFTEEHREKIGKANRGKKHFRFIDFSKEQIDEIVIMREDGKSFREIAKKFNCSPSTILYRIKGIKNNAF